MTVNAPVWFDGGIALLQSSGAAQAVRWSDGGILVTHEQTGGGAYTLSCDAGSFALTGVPASLLRGYKISSEAGTFTLSGSTASLLVGRKIQAEAGSFALTGQPVSLLYGRRIAADHGVFSLTGQGAVILYGRRIDAQPGAFALTGSDADLIYHPIGSYVLSCDAGTFELTGFPATLTRSGVGPDIVIPMAFTMGDKIVVIAAPVTSISLSMVPSISIDIPFNIDLNG
jgi:hypothetical protein